MALALASLVLLPRPFPMKKRWRASLERCRDDFIKRPEARRKVASNPIEQSRLGTSKCCFGWPPRRNECTPRICHRLLLQQRGPAECAGAGAFAAVPFAEPEHPAPPELEALHVPWVQWSDPRIAGVEAPPLRQA